MTKTFTMYFSTALLTAGLAGAGTVDLITNGTFESGNLTGWTTANTPINNTTGSCNNGFAVQTSATGCVSGINPIYGTHAAYSSTSFPAISNDFGEWIDVVQQDVLVPNGSITSAILNWSFAGSWGGTGVQRDISVLAAVLLNGSLLTNQIALYIPSSSGSQNWQQYSLDLTSLFNAHPGQTLTIAFHSNVEFDTTTSTYLSSASTMNTGIDNVQLLVTQPTSATPEPATLGLTGLALCAGGIVRRKQKKNSSKGATR